MLYRGGAISKNIEDFILKFISSLPYDKKIAKNTIKVVKAHIMQLYKSNILKKDDYEKIFRVLNELDKEILKNYPSLNFEDVHEYIEYAIIKKLGLEIGGNINIGKSRNDQVATAIRMTLREEILEVATLILKLNETILLKAKENIETLIPGYTHQQKAQITTLAHHLLAFYDVFTRDVERLLDVLKRVNLSPLGSAAMVGHGIEGYDRVKIAEILGFDDIVENTEDAIASRDFILETLSVLTIFMLNVSRLIEELILWSMNEVSYIKIPDTHAATSSLMPHKRNPATLEIIRAKVSEVLGRTVLAYSMIKSLPYSYNLDLQELTPHLWLTIDIVKDTLHVLIDFLNKVEFKKDTLFQAIKDVNLLFTDLAEYITIEYKKPFRTVHKVLGELAKKNVENPYVIARYLKLKLGIEVTFDEIASVLNPEKSIYRKKVVGSPNPSYIKLTIIKKEKFMKTLRNKLEKFRAKFNLTF